MTFTQPQIQEETSDFAIVFKPAKMHSTPLKNEENNTLTDWFANTGSADKSLPDFGLMHRLDYETHGLVLFAKNKRSFDFFKELQNNGDFIKEYSAICQNAVCQNAASEISADGFPPPPNIDFLNTPKTIMSYFRPYGPGRKLVRPVVDGEKSKKEIAKDGGGFYRTEIIETTKTESGHIFTVRIRRGFRHQIRCHLRWIGFPILGDPLYNTNSLTQRREDAEGAEDFFLKLRAHALIFFDPSTGERREWRIAMVPDTDL